MFSDLSDSTTIADLLEAEEYCDLLGEVRALYQAVIARHEGAVAQMSGDGMLAVFGHAGTREGDGRRAVEAALDLHAAVRALGARGEWNGVPLNLHTGILSGLVLFRDGDPVRGRFELPGAATNIASRLCDAAQTDQILVSEVSLGPERHLFDFDRRLLAVKGRDAPLPTLKISGRALVESRYAASVRGGLTPFVGREAELARIEGERIAAADGETRIVEIAGPAGVGKTRLAEEFLFRAQAKGCTLLRGECDAAGAPLRPFLQIAQAIAATTDDEGNAIAAIAGLIRAAARSRQLILFIDDWQLADDASRELLALLCNPAEVGLLIVLTARAHAEAPTRATGHIVIALAPFDERETAHAVTRLLPTADPFTMAVIRNSSGGNPLFIEELCHSVTSGMHRSAPSAGTAWLDALIESRFERLARDQADLLRIAAVIGTVVPSLLLERVSGRTASDTVFARLADEDFLFPGERPGTMRFKHGITRDVIYNGIGLRERRALHLRIAGALREPGDAFSGDELPETLAYHYREGGDAVATARYAEIAGDKAMTVSALDRAQANYRAALGALERMPASDEATLRWGRIAQRFGRAGVFDPSRDQLPVFERAVMRATASRDRAALAWAQYWLGYIHYGLGEPIAAVGHCERALEAALEVRDERFIVQIRATLGQAKAAACDYPGGLALLDQAIAIQSHRHAGRPSASFGYTLSCKAFALGDMGRFAEAHACFERATAAISGAPREVRVSVLNQHAVTCLWQGELDRARQLAEEGAAVAERVASHYSHAMSRSITAFARWTASRDPAAVAVLVDAAAWLEASGRGQYTSLNHGWLSEVMAAEGRVADARRHAARALSRAHKRDRLGEAMAMRSLARIAAGAGEAGRAERYLARAERSAQIRRSAHETQANLRCREAMAGSSRPAPAIPSPLRAPMPPQG